MPIPFAKVVQTFGNSPRPCAAAVETAGEFRSAMMTLAFFVGALDNTRIERGWRHLSAVVYVGVPLSLCRESDGHETVANPNVPADVEGRPGIPDDRPVVQPSPIRCPGGRRAI